MAKSADSDSSVFYSLEVTANGGDFLIRFSYLPASRMVHAARVLSKLFDCQCPR